MIRGFSIKLSGGELIIQDNKCAEVERLKAVPCIAELAVFEYKRRKK